MRGALIKSPWMEMILEGKKVWEIRSKHTALRELIALIHSKSGQIFGTADLVACHRPFNGSGSCFSVTGIRCPGSA